jgi:hypothetical protein
MAKLMTSSVWSKLYLPSQQPLKTNGHTAQRVENWKHTPTVARG